MTSRACLQLTEATLAYPTTDMEHKEEITLWGPETLHAMPGAAAWMRDEDAYYKICVLMRESGMDWDNGPYRSAVLAIRDEMKEMEEIDTAYELWSSNGTKMDDLHTPSLFTEYNQATGDSEFIGADQIQKNMKIPQFTPEMLAQRDDLNQMFNFRWNTNYFPSSIKDPSGLLFSNSVVPDQTELLEITATGDNHGVAKCAFGAVFVPKAALKYLEWNGGAEVGTIFDGEITFTPDNKFPWRLKKNGVTWTYNEGQDDY